MQVLYVSRDIWLPWSMPVKEVLCTLCMSGSPVTSVFSSSPEDFLRVMRLPGPMNVEVKIQNHKTLRSVRQDLDATSSSEVLLGPT
jgi:hypothetical protein